MRQASSHTRGGAAARARVTARRRSRAGARAARCGGASAGARRALGCSGKRRRHAAVCGGRRRQAAAGPCVGSMAQRDLRAHPTARAARGDGGGEREYWGES